MYLLWNLCQSPVILSINERNSSSNISQLCAPRFLSSFLLLCGSRYVLPFISFLA